jgi:hypothetical protein
MAEQRRSPPRKLLVASVGVATVTYVALTSSCGSNPTVANLVVPPADASEDFPVANLVAPPADGSDQFRDATNGADATNGDATTDAKRDAVSDHSVIDDFPVANLVAPPFDGSRD